MLRIALILILLSISLPAHGREILRGPVEATLIKVRDGDSIDVVARVWPGTRIHVSVRLRGIDAPELRARCPREKIIAKAARDRLQLLLDGQPVRLTKISGGKYYGRVLARVLTADGTDVQSVLLRENLVRPYRGRKRKGWCNTQQSLSALD